MQEHKINIIFAVTASQIHIYKQLTGDTNTSMSLIEGASAGVLKSDSSNVVQLIEDEYKKITSTIELKDNSTSDVTIVYESSCLNSIKERTNVCKGLRVGDSVSFDLTITLNSCPNNSSEWNQTILVYPVGLTDALYIDLSMICSCDCEQPWNKVYNSDFCQGRGTYQCGICSCDNKYYGNRCECDLKESNSLLEEQRCINANDTKPCSGRGVCQ